MDEGPSGNNDPGKAPALAVHWAFTGLGYCIFIPCAVYTQYQLYTLKRNKTSSRLQMLISPGWVSTLLLCIILYSIPPLIYGAAIQPMPCVIYAMVPQIACAGMTAIEIYTILTFTKRLAEIQSSKQYLLLQDTRSSSGGRISNDGSVSSSKNEPLKYARFITKVAATLQGQRVKYICSAIFIFFVLTITFSSNGRMQLANTAEVCTLVTSFYTIFGWLAFAMSYLLFLKKFTLIDPLKIYYKIKFITSVSLGAVITFFILQNAVEPQIGTPHASLFGSQVFFVFMMTLWYLESYIPLKLTRQNIVLAKSGANKHDVLDTLTNADMLVLFEQHLIQEWSIETLEFVQSVLIFEIVGRNSFKRALKKKDEDDRKDPMNETGAELLDQLADSLRERSFEIYASYIQEGAAKQVNFSANVLYPLNKHFDGPIYDRYRKNPHEFEVDDEKLFNISQDRFGIHSRSASRTVSRAALQTQKGVNVPEKDNLERLESPIKPCSGLKQVWLGDASAPISQSGSIVERAASPKPDRSRSPGPGSFRKTSSTVSPIAAPSGTATAMQLATSPRSLGVGLANSSMSIGREDLKLQQSKSRGSSILSNLVPKSRKHTIRSISKGGSELMENSRLKREFLKSGMEHKKKNHQRNESQGMSIRKQQVKRFCDLLTEAALEKLKGKKKNEAKRRPSTSSVAAGRDDKMEQGMSTFSAGDATHSISRGPKSEIRKVLKVFESAKAEVLHLLQNDSHARFMAKLNRAKKS